MGPAARVARAVAGGRRAVPRAVPQVLELHRLEVCGSKPACLPVTPAANICTSDTCLLQQSITSAAGVACYQLLRWRAHCRDKATASAVIAQHFLPALGGILNAMCKASCLSAADLEALAGSVLKLHAYFQAYSWDITWQSGLVRVKLCCDFYVLGAECCIRHLNAGRLSSDISTCQCCRCTCSDSLLLVRARAGHYLSETITDTRHYAARCGTPLAPR